MYLNSAAPAPDEDLNYVAPAPAPDGNFNISGSIYIHLPLFGRGSGARLGSLGPRFVSLGGRGGWVILTGRQSEHFPPPSGVQLRCHLDGLWCHLASLVTSFSPHLGPIGPLSGFASHPGCIWRHLEASGEQGSRSGGLQIRRIYPEGCKGVGCGA